MIHRAEKGLGFAILGPGPQHALGHLAEIGAAEELHVGQGKVGMQIVAIDIHGLARGFARPLERRDLGWVPIALTETIGEQQ